MSQLNLLGNWTVMPPSTEGRTHYAGAQPTQKAGLLPNWLREALGRAGEAFVLPTRHCVRAVKEMD